MRQAFIALTVLVFATGCAQNLGTQTVNDFGRFTALREGETTASDIHRSFGQPHAVRSIDQTGERIWTYASMRATTNIATVIPFVGMVAGGTDVDATVANFYFDNTDTYIRAERTERSRYKNMWLMMGDSMTRSGEAERVCSEMTRLGLPCDEIEARENAANLDNFLE